MEYSTAFTFCTLNASLTPVQVVKHNQKSIKIVYLSGFIVVSLSVFHANQSYNHAKVSQKLLKFITIVTLSGSKFAYG